MFNFLILAAGYGTRLQRDIQADTSGRYTHLSGIPKPLIPLNGQPLIAWWLQWIEALPDDLVGNLPFDHTYIITNHVYHQQFVVFAEKYHLPTSNVIDDGSVSNETRLGAVTDIALLIQHLQKTKTGANEALVVLGGDTLFLADFSLERVVRQQQALNTSAVLTYKCPDRDTKISGVLLLNNIPYSGEVFGKPSKDGIATAPSAVNFLEKPEPTATPSRAACPCWYLYIPEDFSHILEYVKANRNQLSAVDAPGHLVKYMITVSAIKALPVSERIDIGNLQTYIEADEYMRKHYTPTMKRAERVVPNGV